MWAKRNLIESLLFKLHTRKAPKSRIADRFSNQIESFDLLTIKLPLI
jgi:hypothetical protein